MAEIELGDLKLSGGKLLIVIPFLGTVAGLMWGGFELYQRLLEAEEALVSYVSPDFSYYEESLSVLDTKIVAAERVVDTLEESIQGEIRQLSEQIDRLQNDIDSTEDIARGADDTVAEATRELRDDVYELEERVNDSIREIDAELRTMRKELEDRIQRILDNPLNIDE
jgi:flagellar biosynthesis/type III secretory pathway protein FliH